MHDHYIVTPVRNAVRTIDETIWSIVSQAGDLHIHYHVQDGQSNDGTLGKIEVWARRLEKIQAELPARVTFTFASESDAGMYDAISKGFARMDIRADSFMSWCNADDTLWPGALEAIRKLSKDLPATDWIMGWPAWFDDSGRLTATERKPRFPHSILSAGLADGIHWPFVQQESTFWRKRLWDRTGGLDPALRLVGDWDLWSRFAQTASLIHVNRQLGAFHVRPGQQSSNLDAYWAEVNQVVPLAQRQQRFKAALHKKADLLTVPVAVEGPNGVWYQQERLCRWQVALLAGILRQFPLLLPKITKLIYEFW